MNRSLTPVHPGDILREEFMEPLEISQYRLAKETHVSPRRINEIVKGQRAVTADTALRLARFFGTSDMFWLNLQARYELDMQREKLGRHLAVVRPLGGTPRKVTGLSGVTKSASLKTAVARRKTR